MSDFDPVVTAEYKAFCAGWMMAHNSRDRSWGPAPPDSPMKAFKQYKDTCNSGHIIRVDGCKACKRMT